MLAYLHATMGRLDHEGQQALLHLSDDSGARVALIVRWQEVANPAP